MRAERRPTSRFTGAAEESTVDDRSLFLAASACLLERARGTAGTREARLCLHSPHSPETVSIRLDPVRMECLDGLCAGCPALIGRGDAEAAGVELPCGRATLLPILYRDRLLGSMVLGHEGRSAFETASLRDCHALAKDISYEIARAQLRRRLSSLVARDLAGLPTSDALRSIEQFVERAAGSHLPVLLVGEPSAEIDYTPFALHFAGPHPEAPFVRVRCNAVDPGSFASAIEEALTAAAGGTVFLQGIEELDSRQQTLLSEILEFQYPAAEAAASDGEASGAARVVAAVQRDPAVFAAGEDIEPCLLEALDFLRLEISPLRQRRREVRPLVRHFLTRHAQGGTPRRLSEEAMAMLEAYDWPGNVYELERAAARLALLGDSQVLGIEAVCGLLPRIVERMGGGEPEDRLVQFLLHRGPSAAGRSCQWLADLHLLRLADALLRSDFSCTEQLHPAVRRALVHLAAHFREEMTLKQLAAQAHLSPSHLSALFARQLGAGFKRLLILLRLRCAARLLEQDPDLGIGEASEAAGFGELRYCERSFRDHFGCSPSEYRRHVAEGDPRPRRRPDGVPAPPPPPALRRGP